jgi:opacity protein-like surface antigen
MWPDRHWHSGQPRFIIWLMTTASRSAYAAVLAIAGLSLGTPAAHAQSVPYWTTTTGFGSALTSDPNASPYGNLSSRFNFENGWFVGSARGNPGFGATSFTPVTAFGNPAGASFQSVQTGYNFQSAPVSVYAGLDTLKFNSPIGSPFAGLDSSSANSATSYGVRAGVEIRPMSNLSVSLGVGFSQQPSDLNSALLPGASPLAFGRRY